MIPKSSARRPVRTESRPGVAVASVWLDAEVAADVEACVEELGEALVDALSSSEEASAAWAGAVALMLMPAKRA